MNMKSIEFSSYNEAERFKALVHGFIEITTDDMLDKKFIVFWPA